MKHKVFQVFEHGYLYQNTDGLTENEFNLLVQYNDKHAGKYFEVGLKRIRFKQYVGAIQVGKLVIEVLPKADKRSSKPEDVDKWRKALLDMLHKSRRVKVHSLPEASLAIKSMPLMDVYLKQFLLDVESIVHKGLIKSYRKEQGNELKLRGRMVFSKHIRSNMLHKERFYTEHTIYDKNNIHNQILSKALRIVTSLSSLSDIRSDSQRLQLSFEGVDEIHSRSPILDRVPKTRKTGYYDSAIDLALMIIKNYSPDIISGTNNVLALLFDMNSLFEDYVFRLFKKSEADFIKENLKVSRQVSNIFWGNRTMLPDIVMTYDGKDGGSVRVILDTKWKNIEDNKPSFNDLRQMYTYNIHIGGMRSVLIYPNCNNKNTVHVPYAKSVGVLEDFHGHSCQLCFMDLLNINGILNLDAGKNIISNLIER